MKKTNPGRPHKPHAVRDSTTGRSRGDDEKHYRAIRLAYRQREMEQDGIDGEPADPLVGYTLGRLKRAGKVSDVQFRAGEAWARLCHRHAAIMGYELKPPKSPAAFGIVGRSLENEPDEAVVKEVRNLFADCYNALMAVCRDHGLSVREVTYAVCIAGVPLHVLVEKDFGDLRLGLNALAKVLGGDNGINAKSGIRVWMG